MDYGRLRLSSAPRGQGGTFLDLYMYLDLTWTSSRSAKTRRPTAS